MKLKSALTLAIAAVLLVSLVVFQFLGKADDESGGASGDLPKVVTIGAIVYPHQGEDIYSGLTEIIVRDGWLKAELAKKGVELALFPIPTAIGGPLINESFAGKRIDFSSYGDFPALIAVSGGVPLKLVAPLGRGQNAYLVVRNGVSANSIEDLKGKRIALHRGRPWELSLFKLLDSKGLKPGDFTIVNINPLATRGALASGDVDAAFTMSDGILLAKQGLGRIIWSTKEGPADWKMRAELFGRAEFVDRYPELTQIIVNAHLRAAHWSAQEINRDQVIADAARLGLPEDIVRTEYDEPRISWVDRFSPLYDQPLRTHYHSVADYTFERGLVRSRVDIDQLLDTRFVDAGLKQLGYEGYWTPGAAETAR